MVTDKDHIEALRNRLLIKQKEKEQELSEIQEMIRVLSGAPKVLESKPLSVGRLVPTSSPQPIKQNKNLAEQVRLCVSEAKLDEAISIGELIKTLKAEHGVVGKDRSLYAYIHSILKKETQKKDGLLRYRKGVGFYRSRKDQDTLVASI